MCDVFGICMWCMCVCDMCDVCGICMWCVCVFVCVVWCGMCDVSPTFKHNFICVTCTKLFQVKTLAQ